MREPFASTRKKRALIVNQPWDKKGNTGLTLALQTLGYEVVQIPNNSDGWGELDRRGICECHDFMLTLFNGGNIPVDDMLRVFLEKKPPVEAPFSRRDSSCEGCPPCPEH